MSSCLVFLSQKFASSELWILVLNLIKCWYQKYPKKKNTASFLMIKASLVLNIMLVFLYQRTIYNTRKSLYNFPFFFKKKNWLHYSIHVYIWLVLQVWFQNRRARERRLERSGKSSPEGRHSPIYQQQATGFKIPHDRQYFYGVFGDEAARLKTETDGKQSIKKEINDSSCVKTSKISSLMSIEFLSKSSRDEESAARTKPSLHQHYYQQQLSSYPTSGARYAQSAQVKDITASGNSQATRHHSPSLPSDDADVGRDYQKLTSYPCYPTTEASLKYAFYLGMPLVSFQPMGCKDEQLQKWTRKRKEMTRV